MKTARILTVVAIMAIPCGAPIAMAAGAASQPAARQGSEHGKHPELAEKIHEILKGLDLSADQKTQIHTLVEDFKSKMETWRDAHKDELKAVREKIEAARAAKDKEALKAALQNLKTLMESAPKPKTLIDSIADVLTPAQKEKFEKAVKELRETARERMSNRRDAKGKTK